MQKAAFWLIAGMAVILGLGGGAYYAWSKGMYATTRGPLEAPRELPLTPEASAKAPGVPVGATIYMTPQGYTPRTVFVSRGQAVMLVNAGEATMRPTSSVAAFQADGFVYPGRYWYAVPQTTGKVILSDMVYPQLEATIEIH